MLTQNGIIWIRGYNGYIYPYSSITNRFLGCRVQGVDQDIYDRTLFFVGDYLFDFGYDPIVLFHLELINRYIILSDNKLSLSDWFFPEQPIILVTHRPHWILMMALLIILVLVYLR